MKVKKTTKSTLKKKTTKKASKKSEEPMVKVLNLNVNPENPRNGFFELDWNDEFVNMLKQSGYQGASEEEIVDRWFQTLSILCQVLVSVLSIFYLSQVCLYYQIILRV